MCLEMSGPSSSPGLAGFGSKLFCSPQAETPNLAMGHTETLDNALLVIIVPAARLAPLQ